MQPLDQAVFHSADDEITLTRYRNGDQYPLANILADTHVSGRTGSGMVLNRNQQISMTACVSSARRS